MALFAYVHSFPEESQIAVLVAGIALHGVCFDFFLAAGFIHTDNKAPVSILGSAQALFSFLTYGVGMWIGNEVSGKRATKLALPFDLTVADVIIPDACPILGIPLSKGSGRCQANSPSLDRRNPSLGYVRGNVAVISHRANTIKNDATTEELAAVLNWLSSD